MTNLTSLTTGAIAAMVTGMMLVVGGVLVRGLYMPGVVILGLGMLGLAVAGVIGIWKADDA